VETRGLASRLEKAEVLLAIKPTHPVTPFGQHNPLALAVITTPEGRVRLPIFTGVESFQRFAPDGATLAHRLPGIRALQVAEVMGLDEIDVDFGAPHSCRIDRRTINICLEHLNNSLD